MKTKLTVTAGDLIDSANRDYMVLAWEEADEMLDFLKKRKNVVRLNRGAKKALKSNMLDKDVGWFDRKVRELRTELVFGREMKDYEEKAYLNECRQISE